MANSYYPRIFFPAGLSSGTIFSAPQEPQALARVVSRHTLYRSPGKIKSSHRKISIRILPFVTVLGFPTVPQFEQISRLIVFSFYYLT